MSRITSHYFQDHDPVVTSGRRLQLIQCISRYLHRGVIANRNFCHTKVIVDCFRNTNEVNSSFLRKLVQNIEATITSNPD